MTGEILDPAFITLHLLDGRLVTVNVKAIATFAERPSTLLDPAERLEGCRLETVNSPHPFIVKESFAIIGTMIENLREL